jgi:hypothetical protein
MYLVLQYLDIQLSQSTNSYQEVRYKDVVGRLDMYRTKNLMYRMMVLMVRLTKVRC